MTTPAISPETTAPKIPQEMMSHAASTAQAIKIRMELPHVPVRSAFSSVIMLDPSLQRTEKIPMIERMIPIPAIISGALTRLTISVCVRCPATAGRAAPSAEVARMEPQ